MMHSLSLGLLLLQAPQLDSLRLPEATAFARAHRGSVAAAAASVDEARAGLSIRRGLPNPTASYAQTTDTPRRSVAIQQSFDWLLSRGGSVGAGRAQLTRARADLEGATRDLTREVHTAFVGALAAREARHLAEAQLAVADTLARIAARRLSAGDIPEAESDRLRLERILAAQTLSRARAEEARASLALARTLGWPGESTLPPLAGSLADGLDRPAPAPPPLADLPSVRGAVADSAAAAGEASSASWARLPLPTLELGRQWDDPSAPGARLWTFGASIPIPIFNHGGGTAALAQARARIATADLFEARLGARQQLGDAAVQLDEARLRARLASDSLLPGAARLRSRAARAYALGETGALPLLEALRTEREIVAGALNDLLAYQEALADWNSLTGSTE
jgi:outer membrane protein TolC